MPLVGARGYSVTLAGGDTRPHHALYLAEAKVGISSYDDTVRIAGVFELGFSSDRGRPASARGDAGRPSIRTSRTGVLARSRRFSNGQVSGR